MAPNTIKLSDELETRIKDALAPLHPEKAILFGSYAWDQPTEDSDIDLQTYTSQVRRNRQQLRSPDHERRSPPVMKRATGQRLESAEMDRGGIDQIIRREDLTAAAAFHSPHVNPINSRQVG